MDKSAHSLEDSDDDQSQIGGSGLKYGKSFTGKQNVIGKVN